jgi:hypothetical protein
VLRIQSDSLSPWLPSSCSQRAIDEAIAAHPSLPAEKALLDRSLAWAPLDWYHYYLRGYVCIQVQELAKEAPSDFQHAIFLERRSAVLMKGVFAMGKRSPFSEGRVICRQIMALVVERDKKLFVELYDPEQDQMDARGLSAAAMGDLTLSIEAVILQKPENFDQWRRPFLNANPTLAGIPIEVARRFFDRWEACGDVKELVASWPGHSDWKEAGWRAYVNGLAKEAQYSQAVETTLELLPVLPTPPRNHPALQEAEFAFRANPQDVYCGIQLYLAQKALGEEEALITLRTVSVLPNCPDYVPYTLALALHASHQDEEAWAVLAKLVQKG